jgi:hypothetical protein
MSPLYSVQLVDLNGTGIVTLPNMAFRDWSEGHLVAYENVVYVVRRVSTQPRGSSESVIQLAVERARL